MLSLTACSSGEQVSSSILNNRRTKYDLTDNAGKFKVEREVFYQKKNNDFIIKRKVFSKSKKSTNILEKSITISKLGKVKKLPLLRPSVSQYSVWFDGKKYFSEMKVDVKKKAIVLRMKSPEKQWNGQKTIKFPKGNGVFDYHVDLLLDRFLDRGVFLNSFQEIGFKSGLHQSPKTSSYECHCAVPARNLA
ncbi:MAG: hypothetical protein HOM21_10870 [Halobacteriovoraceae bacterium]|nr:hypothetical protein [Halobacteriovoraceae bacterium]